MFEHEELPLATLRLRRETSGELLKACRGRVFELEDEIVALDVQIAEREGSDAFGFARVGEIRGDDGHEPMPRGPSPDEVLFDEPASPWADTPQAAQIDAVILRASRLAKDEIRALQLAWKKMEVAAYADIAVYEAHEAICVAARGAAWCSGRLGAYEALKNTDLLAFTPPIWSALIDFSRTTPFDSRILAATDWRPAALGAARALLVRDLIDKSTAWNQAAYDSLVATWASVIGPVHPDDAVRS